MQITETLALADLTAVFSAALAAIVAITGYRNTKQSARQTFDNFTLRFIETENADGRLHAARQWLEQAVADPDENLALYADIRQFFAARHLSDGLKVQEEGLKALYGTARLTILKCRGCCSVTVSAAAIWKAWSKSAIPPQKPCFMVFWRKMPTALSAVVPFCMIMPVWKALFLRAKKNDGEYARAFCRLVQRWQNPD